MIQRTPAAATPAVAVIEPCSVDRRFLLSFFEAAGYATAAAEDLEGLTAALEDAEVSAGCILTPHIEDLAAIAIGFPNATAIFMPALPGDWQQVNLAIRAGAFGIWPKALDAASVRTLIRSALRQHVVAVEGEPAKIRHALEDAGGKVTDAASKLGISRFALRRAMHKHGIGHMRLATAI